MRKIKDTGRMHPKTKVPIFTPAVCEYIAKETWGSQCSKLGDYPGLSGWVQANHVSPLKVESILWLQAEERLHTCFFSPKLSTKGPGDFKASLDRKMRVESSSILPTDRCPNTWPRWSENWNIDRYTEFGFDSTLEVCPNGLGPSETQNWDSG